MPMGHAIFALFGVCYRTYLSYSECLKLATMKDGSHSIVLLYCSDALLSVDFLVLFIFI